MQYTRFGGVEIWVIELNETKESIIQTLKENPYYFIKVSLLFTLKDLIITSKREVGILTETYRKATKYRSIHPMFSFCSNTGESIGKTAESNPFLGDCVYQRLLVSNALMVFLGIDIKVCTFIMFV